MMEGFRGSILNHEALLKNIEQGDKIPRATLPPKCLPLCHHAMKKKSIFIFSTIVSLNIYVVSD